MNSDEILFHGRLTERPSEAPRCGDIKVAVAYKFEVQRVIKGTLTGKTAVVLIPCPDLLGDKFFVEKAEYFVEASTDLTPARSYTVYNDYQGSAMLWTLKITRP